MLRNYSGKLLPFHGYYQGNKGLLFKMMVLLWNGNKKGEKQTPDNFFINRGYLLPFSQSSILTWVQSDCYLKRLSHYVFLFQQYGDIHLIIGICLLNIAIPK